MGGAAAPPPRFRERRLDVLQSAEDFLRHSQKLTERRLQALNHTRFEIARVEWTKDPDIGREIIQKIGKSQPNFQPHGSTAPMLYRLIYRFIGFHFAEVVAALRRRLASKV